MGKKGIKRKREDKGEKGDKGEKLGIKRKSWGESGKSIILQ